MNANTVVQGAETAADVLGQPWVGLAISLVEEAVKIEPQLAAELRSFLSNPNPQASDWAALRAKVLTKSYGDYVPASAIQPQ